MRAMLHRADTASRGVMEEVCKACTRNAYTTSLRVVQQVGTGTQCDDSRLAQLQHCATVCLCPKQSARWMSIV